MKIEYIFGKKNAMSKEYSNTDMKSRIRNIIKEEERKTIKVIL